MLESVYQSVHTSPELLFWTSVVLHFLQVLHPVRSIDWSKRHGKPVLIFLTLHTVDASRMRSKRCYETPIMASCPRGLLSPRDVLHRYVAARMEFDTWLTKLVLNQLLYWYSDVWILHNASVWGMGW